MFNKPGKAGGKVQCGDGVVGSKIKVYLSDGETGWATLLAPGMARLDNIPFDGPYNIDDIVKIKPGKAGEFPVIEKLLDRPYPVKEVVHIENDGQFALVGAIIRLLGGKCEGGVGPAGGRPGFMAVACCSDVSPRKLAAAIGISNS